MLVSAAGFVFSWFSPGVWETATQKLFHRGPIDVEIEDDQTFLSDGWSVALPSSLPENERPDPGTDGLKVRAWLLDQGGVDAGESNLRMIVRGIGRNTTLLTGMEARVLSRYPVFDGTLVQSPSAGAVEVIAVSFDLDAPRPVARFFDEESGHFRDPYFADNVVTITPGEIVVFNVKALAKEATYNWVLDIGIQYDGKEQTLTVDRGGTPFRTTAWPNKYSAYFNWAWYESPAHFLPVNEAGLPIDG
ncbi:hypothetical protein [Novosphingobium sp.]|uniref:hypothetical protein n=1 Tax=Novosphingobium sp. TaxID=1874826 RepID=UPI003D6C778E